MEVQDEIPGRACGLLPHLVPRKGTLAFSEWQPCQRGDGTVMYRSRRSRVSSASRAAIVCLMGCLALAGCNPPPIPADDVSAGIGTVTITYKVLYSGAAPVEVIWNGDDEEPMRKTSAGGIFERDVELSPGQDALVSANYTADPGSNVTVSCSVSGESGSLLHVDVAEWGDPDGCTSGLPVTE